MLTILLLSFFILTIPNPCFAAPDHTIVCYNPWQVTTPDTQVVFNLNITNPNTYSFESFTLYTTGLPENWDAGFYLNNNEIKVIGLEPGKSAVLTLKVFVPENATARDYQFQVWVSGLYLQASSTLTITVEEVFREINLSSPLLSQAIIASETASYPLEIENGGDAVEKVFLYASVPAGWRKSFTIDGQTISNLTLRAREKRWIVFSATPPDTAQPGGYSLKVLAVTGDGKYNASLSLTLTVDKVPRGISLSCPFSSQRLAAGETTSYPIRVENGGDAVEKVFLYASVPAGWRKSFTIDGQTISNLMLQDRESRWVTFSVTSLSTTQQGDYLLDILAVTEDGRLNATLSLRATIVPYYTGDTSYETTIRCREPWQGTLPDTTVNFNLEVVNLSPKHESYFLKIMDLPKNWRARFYLGTTEVKAVEIEASKAVNLVLKVDVPGDAAPGDYSFCLKAEGSDTDALKALTISVEEIVRQLGLSCPFESQTALTGKSLSYPIEVQNNGDREERIYLSVKVSTELMKWQTSFITDSQTIDNLVLKPGRRVWISFNIKPPYLVSAGQYALTVVAGTEDGEFNATLPLTAVIVAYYRLEISGFQPINPKANAGEEVHITVTVKNTGESPVTRLRLNITAPPTLSNIVVIPLDVLSLDPGLSTNFLVRASPPPETTPGDYVLRIQAVSNEQRTDVGQLIVSIATPIPWYWIGIGITIIATALVVIGIQQLFSRFRIKVRKAKST